MTRTYIGHYKRFGQPNHHMAVYRLEDGRTVNDQNVEISLDKRVLVSGPEDGGEVCGCALCQRKARLAPPKGFDGCTCTEFTLHFHLCQCGVRQRVLEAEAEAIVPMLSDEQVSAMVEVTGAIEQRKADNLGYGLKKLQLSTGWSRSGDNAVILTDLGKIVQDRLRKHLEVVKVLST
jgi:hypothetical protein